MQYNWDLDILFTHPYFDWLMSGLLWTVLIASAAWVVAFIVGSAVGIARTLPFAPIRLAGTAYVEIFRNIPLIVQMFLWFFVVPNVVPNSVGYWMKREMFYPEYTTAVVCLGFYTASRIAEQVRAGLESVHKDLRNAALATGLTLAQVYRYVFLPIGYRLIVPPMTSEFLGVFKNSSVALTIGMLELTAQSRQIESYTFKGFEAFAAASVLYLLITWLTLFLMRRFESRTRVPGMVARGSL